MQAVKGEDAVGCVRVPQGHRPAGAKAGAINSTVCLGAAGITKSDEAGETSRVRIPFQGGPHMPC